MNDSDHTGTLVTDYSRTFDRIVMVGCAAALGVLAFVGFYAATNDAPKPCPTEDSVDCFWNAAERGNGLGQSFVVDADGRITYVK